MHKSMTAPNTIPATDPAGRFRRVFNPGAVIGMVHVGALPGSPGYRANIGKLARDAAAEASVLAQAGFDAVMIENMHDAPYVNGPHSPEVVACMTKIAAEVSREIANLPLGVQVLSRGEREAMAIAQAARPDPADGPCFIRCENFVFAHVADEGLMPDAAAGPLLRYRRGIDAEHVLVLADIKKKHAAHAITADASVADAAKAAAFFGADAAVVTGAFTGAPTDERDIESAADSGLPVVVGSGATPASLSVLFKRASAVIVGSWIKEGGQWRNPVEPARAQDFVSAARQARRL